MNGITSFAGKVSDNLTSFAKSVTGEKGENVSQAINVIDSKVNAGTNIVKYLIVAVIVVILILMVSIYLFTKTGKSGLARKPIPKKTRYMTGAALGGPQQRYISGKALGQPHTQ